MSFVYRVMVFCLVLVVILIILASVEAALHRRRVRAVPLRILVNGTRGKTTVTRLLQCALKEGGHTVLAKTTGSEATYILPDGTIKSVDRRRGVNVLRETIAFFRLATGLKVDAVVLECQAVRAENQILVRRLVEPTISLITNARIDHIDLMGDSVKSTAEVLRLSVPKGQKFYTSDPLFQHDEQAVVVPTSAETSDVNRVLALRVLGDLGIPKDSACVGFEAFVPDIGLCGPFTVKGRKVVNAFAANDMQSSIHVLDGLWDSRGLTIVYNNRSDREFRLLYFANVFSTLDKPLIVVIGDHVQKCRRFLSRKVSEARVLAFKGTDSQLLDLCTDTVVCMGNIKGRGEVFIRFCQGGV